MNYQSICKIFVLFLVIFITNMQCNIKASLPDEYEYSILGPSNKLVQNGKPKVGLDYLLHGDYIGAGLPYEFFGERIGTTDSPLLVRGGKNQFVNHGMNVFTAQNKVTVIAGLNCFACHAAEFENTFIIGLGNSDIEMNGYTNISAASGLLQNLVETEYGNESAEAVISHQFLRGFRAVAPHIETPFKGINPAFRIEETAAAHRNPIDLTWSDTLSFQYLPYVIASDTPPWWHVKKKHGLYYNGMGRGAFSKMMEQISVVAIQDSSHARAIHTQFIDVLAYIESIEPPRYPQKIDTPLAAKGKPIFQQHCQTCHGEYGENETYPNKLIPISEVETDPYYARMLFDSPVTDWYNESWYSHSSPASRMEPTLAYIAPPLDGVWCTAPYLHNGSVPNLHTLLNSKSRPEKWKKEKIYDYTLVGWAYKEVMSSDETNRNVYNTQIKGYSNVGHFYGDKLNDKERLALIEYLKTL